MEGDSVSPDRETRRSRFRRKTRLPGGFFFFNGSKTNRSLITCVPPIYLGGAQNNGVAPSFLSAVCNWGAF